MNRPASINSQIILDYLERWAGLPNLTLAKKIYAEHPEKFRDVESVRSIIRAYAGASGDQNRKRYKNTKFYDRQTLPETYAPDYGPYVLPKSVDNILVLSDIHLPFHDPEPIEQAVRWGKQHEVNAILLNGDQIDCYKLSRFIKDSRYPTIRQELDSARQFLDYLQSQLPKAVIYWKNGNHEDRIETFLKIKAPELLDVVDWQIDTLLQFGSRGVQFITDKRIIYAGKLPILHGHEFYSKSTGQVNPARTLYLKSGHSALVAHLHITSEHTDKHLNGDVITCWSVGCLCGLHPEYARINKWNHGFARVKVQNDGTFKVANIRIIDGKIY